MECEEWERRKVQSGSIKNKREKTTSCTHAYKYIQTHTHLMGW